MTDTAVSVDAKAPAIPGKMPPVVRLPKPVQGVLLSGFRRRFLRSAVKRYGPVFAINVPFFGRSVVVADPTLLRQVFLASTDDLMNVQPNLSRIFGPGSVFALDVKEHRARRKLLAPPFHGQSIKNYEKVIEEETLRETATWPEGAEFPTLEPMNRITLNVILRTVSGPTARNSTSCAQSFRPGPSWGRGWPPCRSRRSAQDPAARGAGLLTSAPTSTAPFLP
jgi:cytochrome P450 family 138